MEKLGILIIILLLISLGMSGFVFYKTYQGQWVYIGEMCVDYITGDEWIEKYCKEGNWKGENTTVCVFYDEEKKMTYTTPLYNINISEARECREYNPITSAFIKTDRR